MLRETLKKTLESIGGYAVPEWFSDEVELSVYKKQRDAWLRAKNIIRSIDDEKRNEHLKNILTKWP